ncbi:PspC domain-containing protein [Arthrobacter sp. TMP15]|uniref:PspC domain-containing protein n=1 Tax=Arthrobacter sp. TMP15 TaxID=3140789 RepID=UPI0031BB4D87
MNIPQDTPEQNTPEQNTPEPPPLPTPEPASSAKFFQWLRGLGVQRGSNRWVGGVCSGLANKWGIDPVIVRGLTVVLTLFFGVGLLAYGVAWALLPEPDGRIHVEQVSRGHWSTGMTGAALLTVLGFAGPGQGFLFDGYDSWFPWPLFWIAAVAGVIYWAVNRHKPTETKSPYPLPGQHPLPGQQNTGVRSQPYQSAPYFPAAAPGSFAAPQQQYAPQQPVTFDPRMYVKHPVKTTPHLGAAATLLSLGLAVVVGSIVLILNATNIIDLNGYQVATAAAAAAITAGLAIVGAGAMGRTAGGVGSFAIVMLVLASLLSIPPHSGEFTALNNVSWSPTSIEAAEAGQTVVLGNSTIDLTRLDGAASLSSDVLIPLETAAARITIKVPTSVPVTIKSELVAASLSIDGMNDGATLTQDLSTEVNPGVTGNGLVITLQGVASNIKVIPVVGQ